MMVGHEVNNNRSEKRKPEKEWDGRIGPKEVTFWLFIHNL